MVDAVQKWYDGGGSNGVRRGEGERRLEFGRLYRHPQRLYLAVKQRRCWNVRFEVPQHGAFDVDSVGLARQRLGAYKQNYIGARPRERRAQQTADSSRAKNRVPQLVDPASTAGISAETMCMVAKRFTVVDDLI
jgi:hypothetical protein